jgi:hypothetical protein
MMNERIKLLAEQAGIAVWGDAVYMYDPKNTLDSTVMTKFTELIVRECISTLEEKIYRSIDHEGDETWIDLILKEHFGVED